eukprot:3587704-Rhodomonas_salina.1
MRRNRVRLEHAILRGSGPLRAVDTADRDAIVRQFDRVQSTLVQGQLLQTATHLYSELYALGLNAAERDYAFMLSADEHFSHPDTLLPRNKE